MERKKIAAIITEYFTHSHADVIVGKFLRGFPCDDGLHPPRVEIASMYLDQVNPRDIGLATAAEFNVPVFPSILRALTLGGETLAVDGVLIIGEHGEYAVNELGQVLYPRKHLFEQVAGTLASNKRSVPVFVDKHLSYNWPDALWMYRRAQELGIPLMAGSSLPLAWRRPFLEYPLGTPLEAAAVIGYGPIEIYGFHALETLQCMVERRRGYEAGVKAVQCLEGQAVWAWLAENPVHQSLAASCARSLADAAGPWDEAAEHVPEPVAFLVDYRDGLRAVVLILNGYTQSFAFAGLSEDKVQSCEFVLQAGSPYAHFSYLSLNVEEMFLTGRPSYPVERTLLTTGVLAAAMESRYRGHIKLETPHLEVRYTPVAEVPFRPKDPAPTGATLDPWPPKR